jgi:hypothetical protein
MRIELSLPQIKRAQEWVIEKHVVKRDAGSRDLFFSERTSDTVSVDLMGRLGEIAAATAFGLDWDRALDWTTAYLAFNGTPAFRADAAILVQLDGGMAEPDRVGRGYEVSRVCSRQRFLRDAEDRDFGYGVRKVIAADKLRRSEEFLAAIRSEEEVEG